MPRRNRRRNPIPRPLRLDSLYPQATAQPARPLRPRRTARMVPDDRSDERLTFDDVFEAAVAAIEAEAREGRGVA